MGGLCLGLAACTGPAENEAKPVPEPAAETPESAAQTADWAQFRGGPRQQGVAPVRIEPPLAAAWEHDAGAAIKGGAAIAGDRVYVATELGEVICLDLGNGEPVWNFATDGPVEATPLVIDGGVYLGSGDFHFYKLDAATGEEVWKIKTENKILGSANWWRQDGRLRIYVGSYDHHLYEIAASSGEVLARFKTENYVHGTPAVGPEGTLAFGGCDGSLYILEAGGLAPRQEIPDLTYMGASVCLAGETGFIGTYGKEVLAFDLRSGEVLWRFEKSNFPFFSSAAHDAERNRIYVGGRDKKLHALDAATGEERWAFTARGRIDSSPVISGAHVFVGSDDGRLYAIEAATGEEAWSYDLGGRVSAEPAIGGGYLVIGSAGGKVFAFQPAASN